MSDGRNDQAPTGDPRSQSLPGKIEADVHPSGREPEGGQEQEAVEDRPNVGTVKPEDYPAEERGPD